LAHQTVIVETPYLLAIEDRVSPSCTVWCWSFSVDDFTLVSTATGL
jgi:hypothetical protein